MCKYCTNREGKVALISGDHMGLSLSENRPYNVYMWGKDNKGWDISEIARFKYCPMCGEKLIKEPRYTGKELYEHIKSLKKVS